MPLRGDIFASGQYYHIYNRGAGKGLLFFNEENYKFLLNLIKRYQHKYRVTLIAYCLMPNHYHFLLRQDSEIPLSKFINVLFNAYVQAVNIQQGRKGTLFEGRFKHVVVDRWEYLIHLCRYIHLNPVKANLVSRPEDWDFSNYQDWLGLRENNFADKTFIQDHFGSAEDYREFLTDWQDDDKIKKYLLD